MDEIVKDNDSGQRVVDAVIAYFSKHHEYDAKYTQRFEGNLVKIRCDYSNRRFREKTITLELEDGMETEFTDWVAHAILERIIGPSADARPWIKFKRNEALKEVVNFARQNSLIIDEECAVGLEGGILKVTFSGEDNIGANLLIPVTGDCGTSKAFLDDIVKELS